MENRGIYLLILFLILLSGILFFGGMIITGHIIKDSIDLSINLDVIETPQFCDSHFECKESNYVCCNLEGIGICELSTRCIKPYVSLD
jgi:hypothetical protein